MPPIYSLISIDKECNQCQYINAISYSKERLQNMIENIDLNLLKVADFIIKDNTKIYKLIPFNGNILIRNYNYGNISINLDTLYAFNKITTFGVENVLLDITTFHIEHLRHLSIFKNDLSKNTIMFDVFYDEGIMNA